MLPFNKGKRRSIHDVSLIIMLVVVCTSFNPDSALALDTDNDGVDNYHDNCPEIYNPDQRDSDADASGDVCDNCQNFANADQSDADEDQLGNTCDNCPNVANTNQIDSDYDGIGDVCDIQPADINGDDLVDLRDAVQGLKIVSGQQYEGVIRLPDVDIDGDNKIGIAEVIFILHEISQFPR